MNGEMGDVMGELGTVGDEGRSVDGEEGMVGGRRGGYGAVYVCFYYIQVKAQGMASVSQLRVALDISYPGVL